MAMDPVNKKAVKKDFEDRKDQDIDNDGDVDSSDEYLHKRRKAVSKAIKNVKESIELDEKVENLDELSQDTLKSYTKKAGDQRSREVTRRNSNLKYRSQFPSRMNSRDHREYTSLGKSIEKSSDIIRKRSAGLKTAKGKLNRSS